MNVMQKAWEIARNGQRKFGGKVKEYFAMSLRLAWQIVKKGAAKMIQTHTWTNARGMVFTLTAEHITKESRTTDWGEVLEKDVNWVRIHEFLVDGEQVQQAHCINRAHVDGTPVLDLGNVVFMGRLQRMKVMMPAEVNAAVWGQYDTIVAAKKAKQSAAKKPSKHICKKCGTYCWGDCSAN